MPSGRGDGVQESGDAKSTTSASIGIMPVMTTEGGDGGAGGSLGSSTSATSRSTLAEKIGHLRVARASLRVSGESRSNSTDTRRTTSGPLTFVGSSPLMPPITTNETRAAKASGWLLMSERRKDWMFTTVSG